MVLRSRRLRVSGLFAALVVASGLALAACGGNDNPTIVPGGPGGVATTAVPVTTAAPTSARTAGGY